MTGTRRTDAGESGDSAGRVSYPDANMVVNQVDCDRGGAVESTEINVVQHPGLYRVESSSSTVYYVDTRSGGYHFMRARGAGPTGSGPSDNRWVELLGLESGPPEERDGNEIPDADYDPEDILEDVLRVGSRHRYFWRREYWTQRVCTRIEVLERMPEPSALTKQDDWA